MRRTMHAALVALCFTVHAYGQSPDSALPPPVQASPEIAGGGGIPQAVVTHGPQSVETGFSTGCSHCGGGNAVPQFHPLGCDRPYSPLGARMSCNEYSPALWATYPAERAAAIAHLMQHVDHRCDCGHHRNILHSHASAAGCSSGGCHAKAGCDTPATCDSVVVNRYQTQQLQSQPAVASKPKESSVFGLKLPSWTVKAPAGEPSEVKTVPVSPAKTTPVSPYLKSESQMPKTAVLSPVATEPGPVVLAR